MAKKKELAMNLASLDDLFSTQDQREEDGKEKVLDISLSEISEFPNHPFHVKMDSEMEKLVESIQQNGVLIPALVRPKDGGGYEMISGHRRKFASDLAGNETIPCIVRNLTDDESTILSGKTSREILAGEVGESQDQVRRYIRLTYLIPELLQRVDEGKMAMTPAVELSYIPEELQREVFDVMEQEDCSPSHAQTKKMRKLLESGNLSQDSILSVMQEEKPNQKEKITLHADKVSKYIPKSVPIGGREAYILKALEYYAKARERQQEKARREEAR